MKKADSKSKLSTAVRRARFNFGAGDAWLRTKTEVRRSEVPAAVMQAFQTSQYAGWEIDDIDHYDSPERQWYLFELEDPQSDREAELRIQADGTIF